MKLTAKSIHPLPNHVAIVPDGNGRWARKRGLPRVYGHREGIVNMLRMIQYINEHPIKYVTFYGFSTENWNRPEPEVKGLFALVEEFVDKHLEEIKQKNIKIRHIGRLDNLPSNLQNAIKKAVALTANNNGMTLNIAWNYGGRAEIVDAVTSYVKDKNKPQQLDEKTFANYLYTAGIPDVDLLIRTGNETRLSNFLIWQTAYSEYYFTEVLWPDFGKKDIDKALLEYSKRNRRFGGL
ncbi:MAG: di-trans,poly-cis-decaprenylcistransferase [Dehalococcoidales bacterium]|nr:di-trans,poly-cis-decaprenylcistransferase [Dehalococcoidales bacterium]